ncbi:hypothetical protein [Clostridium magnum]|uniref:hypothetical protein n=1 Tax=Clostridium magnum TaxID=33954 RepID=UPI000922DD2E|nr:hypothetical protein [Clostridium magnum]SHJ12351.1 hypothetical protein SAMN02745944_05385 [Clostridium magnum DSM 2767]
MKELIKHTITRKTLIQILSLIVTKLFMETILHWEVSFMSFIALCLFVFAVWDVVETVSNQRKG